MILDAEIKFLFFLSIFKVLKGFKSVHIEGAEFNDLGQEEVLGMSY